MKILFDQGTPVPLRRDLPAHSVETAAELGWSGLSNGDLIAAAEEAGFDLMITTDQNLRYQQNLAARRIGIVVLMTTSWPRIQRQVQKVSVAIDELSKGGYVEVLFE
jgi:hypothetical protein